MNKHARIDELIQFGEWELECQRSQGHKMLLIPIEYPITVITLKKLNQYLLNWAQIHVCTCTLIISMKMKWVWVC